MPIALRSVQPIDREVADVARLQAASGRTDEVSGQVEMADQSAPHIDDLLDDMSKLAP